MSNSFKRTAIIVVALLPVLVLGYVVFRHDNDDVLPPLVLSAPSVTQTLPTPSLNPNSISLYTDGTFTATGSYRSPEGTDALGVTITVKQDVVTDVSFVEKATNSQSRLWQNQFISGCKMLVVGRGLADLHLTNVSGSSLTPIGFNNALDQIRSQAKAI